MRLNGRKLLIAAVMLSILIGQPFSAFANRLYFSGLAVRNSVSGSMMVQLSWDVMDGQVPAELASFRIYRKTGTGTYDEPVTIPNSLAPAQQLQAFFMAPGEDRQLTEIIDWLNRVYPPVNVTNFHLVLHDILNPASAGCTQNPPAATCKYDPIQRQFLSRLSRNVGRAVGHAYLDRPPSAASYTYLLTGVYTDGSETGPLGNLTIDTSTETVLPAPAGFATVKVSQCSSMRKLIDHGRVHFTWSLPQSPADMALRTLVHGYDLFRGELEIGGCPVVDLRSGIPAGLIPVNQESIIVSGNPPETPPDNYLAIDEGDFLSGGATLQPGHTYCYYLAARDIAGGYSDTAGPLQVTVPDMDAPVSPWNTDIQQEMVDNAGTIEPRLTLIWDQINNVNFLNEYSEDKTLCGVSQTEACYVGTGESCAQNRPICLDLDVVEYLIFRYTDLVDMTRWTAEDSDGDLWPDAEEDTNGNGIVDSGETDPCDGTDFPPGPLPHLAALVPQNAPEFVRVQDSGKVLMAFQDTTPQPDNVVYWYRIGARDSSGNLSILTPPLRGALWDRSQPEVANATLQVYYCDYYAELLDDTQEGCARHAPDQNAVLSIIDETGLATDFALYEDCTDHLRQVFSGELIEGRRELYSQNPGDELYDYCTQLSPCGEGDYLVQFFDGNGTLITESEPISAPMCSGRVGCVILRLDCDYITVGIDAGSGHGVTHYTLSPLKVCVDLDVNQCARVYQEIGGDMSPVRKTCYHPPDNGTQNICQPIDVTSIVPSVSCLGVRQFSANYVGSPMHYLPCVSIKPLDSTGKLALPQTPQIEKVTQTGSTNTGDSGYPPKFNVAWGSQSQGISAFIISREGKSGSYYTTHWGIDPDELTGQYAALVPISPTEINTPWCFRVRSVDTALQLSNWSSKLCKTWLKPDDDTHLKWPTIPELTAGTQLSAAANPPSGVNITAFVLNGEGLPAIVLSDDLAIKLQLLPQPPFDCELTVGDCFGNLPCTGGYNSQWTAANFQCDFCSGVRAWNQLGDFVVYRQEENQDFVQVSPLVDQIYCQGLGNVTVEDPMVSIVRLQYDSGSGTHAVGGELAPADPDYVDLVTALEGTNPNFGARMLFFDYYPVKAGTKVRYKILQVDDGSREPEKVYTSNWIRLPTPP